jgi:putative transcriptional regulator
LKGNLQAMTDMSTDEFEILDALIIDYANGTLSKPLEVLVETHMAMNPKSARAFRMMMQIGGVLLEESEPVSMSEGSWEKIMAEIDAHEALVEPAGNDNQEDQNLLLPRPIADYIPALSCTKSWKKLSRGLTEYEIDFGTSVGKASIYRIAPGVAVPSHSHEGSEVTLVLAGGFSDVTGNFGPGDIAVQQTGAVHKPVADDDGECIVFAVNEGSIKLTGPIGMVINLLSK